MKKQLLAEFLGSMFLIMAAVSPIILFDNVFESPTGVTVLANAISVAFVLCVLIEIFAPVSGAHFNPVVTMTMLLEKKINAISAVLFVLFQIVGGLVGIVLSHLMFFETSGGLFFVSDIPRGGHTYVGEIVGTFILIFAILMLVKAKSNKISIMVGLLVGGQIMATSSTMFANPQVTIARMFTNCAAGINPFDGAVYIFMQLAGALFAYVVYKYIFGKEEK